MIISTLGWQNEIIDSQKRKTVILRIDVQLLNINKGKIPAS